MPKKQLPDPQPPSATAPPEPPAVTLGPINIPVVDLSPQNQSFLAKIGRELREMVVQAQHRRADGRLTVDLHIASGQLNGTIHIKPDWAVRV